MNTAFLLLARQKAARAFVLAILEVKAELVPSEVQTSRHLSDLDDMAHETCKENRP